MLAEKYSNFASNNQKNHFGKYTTRDNQKATKNIFKKSSKKIVSLTISTKNYQQEKEAYQWRLKTQFPIVKVLSYELQAYNPNKSMSFLTKNVSVTVQIQNFTASLSQLTQIPLFKILYLLKESLIGMQRLVTRFGYFGVTSEMIVINNESRCNVWLNQNLASNQIQIQCTTQQELLQSLIQTIQERAACSRQIINFFQYIKNYTTIIETLSAIQSFAKLNITKIPTQIIIKYQNQDFKCNSPDVPKFKSPYPSPQKLKGIFFSPNTSLKKVPKFIEKLRSTINYPEGKKYNSTQLKRHWLTQIKNSVKSPIVNSAQMPKSQRRIPTFITLKSSAKSSEGTARFGITNQNDCPFSHNQAQKIAQLIGIQECQLESYRQSIVMLDLSIHDSIGVSKPNQKIPVFQRNQSFLKELDTSSFIINDQRASKLTLNHQQSMKRLESNMTDTGKSGFKWQEKITSLFGGEEQFERSFRQQDQEDQISF